MSQHKTILIVGTYDTKDDELGYLASVILAQGGRVATMDVSVLGEPSKPTDYSKHEVAEAGGSSIKAAIDGGDENIAMQIMADGASALALKLYREGKFDGVIVLGGSMGTDLALDLCAALPLGVPKYVVSTVSFSAMLPPERLAPDIQMILWGGGLYGLNSVCKSSLSQAAGAVLGAARAVEAPNWDKPLIGMTSFGKTVLRYMVALKPALEERGFIRRLPNRARALEIIRLPDGMETTGFQPRVIHGDRPESRPPSALEVKNVAIMLPLMGKIAAGVPIEAISQIECDVAVPVTMLGTGNHFALEVKGDSMIDAGINSGDVVVVKETSVADDGDIVVALVDGQEATLKRLRKNGSSIALEAANPNYKPQVYRHDQVKVQGKLVGLIRTY